jgi:dTDP-4-dehydrorhamnose 3,5-epimerase
MDPWQLSGTTRDAQSVTADWHPAAGALIAGVVVKEVLNVVRDNRVITELYRQDWALDELPVAQVFQAVLMPGAITAWHAHEQTTDRLGVATGTIKVVLYDARRESPTHGVVNELRIGPLRPCTVVVPPKVYHGIQNVGVGTAVLINMPDRPYDYENPDHWRLPWNSSEIPYRFDGGLAGCR